MSAKAARVSEMPVLILSARSAAISKVRGYRDGASDYVTEPFGLRELTARVERAARLLPRRAELAFGEIVVHPTLRRVLRDGAEVAQRPKVVDLLLMLIERPNEVVTRQGRWRRCGRTSPAWSRGRSTGTSPNRATSSTERRPRRTSSRRCGRPGTGGLRRRSPYARHAGLSAGAPRGPA